MGKRQSNRKTQNWVTQSIVHVDFTYLQFGVMMNNADVDFLSCVPVHRGIPFSRVYASDCGTAEPQINNVALVCKVVVPIYTPTNTVWGPTANTWYQWAFKLCQSEERLIFFIVVLIVFLDYWWSQTHFCVFFFQSFQPFFYCYGKIKQITNRSKQNYGMNTSALFLTWMVSIWMFAL